jgi:hypothetical protein
MAKQKHLLKQELTMLVMFKRGFGLAKNSIQQLASNHDRNHLNIDLGWYRLWLEVLLR